MGFVYEARTSDSPYVETVTHGFTAGEGSTIRPAEYHWHMVFVKINGRVLPIVTGPLTTSGIVPFTEGVQILWIKLKLGTFMPHLPTANFMDTETTLPGASANSFWLKSSAWQFPDYENADTFVDRLVRDNVLAHDPIVNAVLQDQLPDMPSRTVRHRFLRATGLPQGHIRQMKRAQQAATLLQQGLSILDTVDEAGYFDQPHLTRSLKQFIGYTPAQIIRMSSPDAYHSVQDNALEPDYHTNALERTANQR